MHETATTKPAAAPARSHWYSGTSRYDWLALAVASAGWIFDSFENQLFNITRGHLLPDLLSVPATHPAIKFYGDVFLGIFLIGGTTGGLLFGSLADRYGRRPILCVTILMYSIFAGLTYFARSLWQVAALRFLVAMGTGGEWSVAAALVSEAFLPRARAQASAIFHASSVLGTGLAALAGIAVGVQWRYAYLLGVVPALLVFWVRCSLRESASWQTQARTELGVRPPGSFRELLGHRLWGRLAILGMLLAAVGLATFWGVTVAAQDVVREFLIRLGMAREAAATKAQFAYGIVVAGCGGVGLVAFGPLAQWLGRKRAFVVALTGAMSIVPVTCYLPATYWQLLLLLPAYGFFTFGFHAGFAIYFPELFPTRLRSTGAGFCFNGGRFLAAPMLWFSGWLKAQPGMDLRLAVTLMALLYSLGILIITFLPETKDQPLTET